MNKILLMLTVVVFFPILLIGCNMEETIEVIKEEEYIVKDIRFVNDFWGKGIAIHVDTDEETLVFSKNQSQFIKSKADESNVKIKEIHDSNRLIPESVEVTFYISKSDIATISRKYADEFGETLIITESKN